MELTRETLKKIRQAHGLYVHAGYEIEPETAVMTLSLESDYGKAYDEVARCRLAIPLFRRLPEGRKAFFSKSSIRQSETWMTIASLLRVGDKLSLDFRPDWHSNGYTRAACGDGHEKIGGQAGFGSSRDPEWNSSLIFEGLHVDSVYLMVERGSRRLAFLLDTSICPENSARMIKLAHL